MPTSIRGVCFMSNMYTIRALKVSHGVYNDSGGGQFDGSEQGYENPPVPSQLVGLSQIPPYLSPE